MKLKFDNIEKLQFDMVSGQLIDRIKVCIPRETVSNLAELVERANRIGERWMGKAVIKRNPLEGTSGRKFLAADFANIKGMTHRIAGKERARKRKPQRTKNRSSRVTGAGPPEW